METTLARISFLLSRHLFGDLGMVTYCTKPAIFTISGYEHENPALALLILCSITKSAGRLMPFSHVLLLNTHILLEA